MEDFPPGAVWTRVEGCSEMPVYSLRRGTRAPAASPALGAAPRAELRKVTPDWGAASFSEWASEKVDLPPGAACTRVEGWSVIPTYSLRSGTRRPAAPSSIEAVEWMAAAGSSWAKIVDSGGAVERAEGTGSSWAKLKDDFPPGAA
eukprot:6184033-Pleurochrysis_carterae.AAC.5